MVHCSLGNVVRTGSIDAAHRRNPRLDLMGTCDDVDEAAHAAGAHDAQLPRSRPRTGLSKRSRPKSNASLLPPRSLPRPLNYCHDAAFQRIAASCAYTLVGPSVAASLLVRDQGPLVAQRRHGGLWASTPASDGKPDATSPRVVHASDCPNHPQRHARSATAREHRQHTQLEPEDRGCRGDRQHKRGNIDAGRHWPIKIQREGVHRHGLAEQRVQRTRSRG